MLEGIVGILAWIAVNGLYVDMRRKGKGGFARAFLFWTGFPWTLLWRFTIPEGSQPAYVPVSEDVEGMLEMVRRERLRLVEEERAAGALPAGDPGEAPTLPGGADDGRGPNAEGPAPPGDRTLPF